MNFLIISTYLWYLRYLVLKFNCILNLSRKDCSSFLVPSHKAYLFFIEQQKSYSLSVDIDALFLGYVLGFVFLPLRDLGLGALLTDRASRRDHVAVRFRGRNSTRKTITKRNFLPSTKQSNRVRSTIINSRFCSL
jgi:hypothetical protein